METNKTVAVIDVGSNSIKLLVARKSAFGVETVFTKTIETRISEGISEVEPFLQDESMGAGVFTIAELFMLASDYAPSDVQIVATSAVRDAVNGREFMGMVEAATGVPMRLLSGELEATYIGRGIACDPTLAGISDFVQMDIGGGSLELIRFSGGEIQQAISLQLGAVRLSERFIAERELPVSLETKAHIESHVEATLAASGFDFAPYGTPMVATGGAFVIARAILAARLGLGLEDSAPVLTGAQLRALELELSTMTLFERTQIEALPEERADIVPTALITILKVLEVAQRDAVTHSLYNLRYGVAAELLG